MNIVYKDVEGFPGYKIGNDGSILSNKRGKGYINAFKNASGYMNAVLYKDGERKTISLHKLIATAFLPNPNNYDCINHKDENPLNNFVYVNPDGSIDYEKSNLEWCSRSYNRNYGTCEERRKKTMASLYAVAQFSLEGQLLNIYSNCCEAARALGLPSRAATSIGQCALGRCRYSHGYIWKKVENTNIEEDKKCDSVEETMKKFYEELFPILGSYKAILDEEYQKLKERNDIWRKEHDGEDNDNYVMKMWAIAAPFNTLEIIKGLYINKK